MLELFRKVAIAMGHRISHQKKKIRPEGKMKNINGFSQSKWNAHNGCFSNANHKIAFPNRLFTLSACESSVTRHSASRQSLWLAQLPKPRSLPYKWDLAVKSKWNSMRKTSNINLTYECLWEIPQLHLFVKCFAQHMLDLPKLPHKRE